MGNSFWCELGGNLEIKFGKKQVYFKKSTWRRRYEGYRNLFKKIPGDADTKGI